MREKFIEKAFYASSRETIDRVNEIVEIYQKQGFTLTVRQLYYQFVSRGWVANTIRSYKSLAATINQGRLAGLIDWDAIEDRTRWLRQVNFFRNPQEFLQYQTEHYYAEQLWKDQNTYCEVWIEKDALVGVIERICNEWRVPYFPCRGYVSQSEQYDAGQRLWRKSMTHERLVVFHLGDHDPSGIDMTRDNEDRIRMFSRRPVEFRRLALNMDQIEEYEPPENPTKETDSRHGSYYDRFGDGAASWELDALKPEIIIDLVDEAIRSVVDIDAFDQRKVNEDENKDALLQAAEDWYKPKEERRSIVDDFGNSL